MSGGFLRISAEQSAERGADPGAAAAQAFADSGVAPESGGAARWF
jgi:hypothetical protein